MTTSLLSLGEIEKQMVSIQRCMAMLEIAQERESSRMMLPLGQSEEFLEKQWPTNGQIKFEDVELRYRPNTDIVLRGISFTIHSGQKIGIVGRTGAGKSTISLALTRIVELYSGHILIDGLNITDLPIQKLRDKITVIPQDASIFQGTLRLNIDPNGLATDEEIIDLLHEAGLDNLLQRKSSVMLSE